MTNVKDEGSSSYADESDSNSELEENTDDVKESEVYMPKDCT